MKLSHEARRKLLTVLLEDVFGAQHWDDSSMRTAERVLGFWREYAGQDPANFELTTFPCDGGQMVVVGDIEFSSICVHHLLPFFGRAHVAYIPGRLQVGLSKIPRVVDHFARRPQVQERLTVQIARYLKERLDPVGVMVVVESVHTCMACRGVRKHNGRMVTSLPLGVFLSNPAARDEFFDLIRLSHDRK